MFTRSLRPVVVQINRIGRHIGPRRESTGTPMKNRSRFTVTVLRMSYDAFPTAQDFARSSRRGGHRLNTSTTPGGRSNLK